MVGISHGAQSHGGDEPYQSIPHFKDLGDPKPKKNTQSEIADSGSESKTDLEPAARASEGCPDEHLGPGD